MALGKGKISSGGSFERIGEGTYPARIARLIDLGIQRDEYQGVVSTRPKVLIEFELPTERGGSGDKEFAKTVLKEMTLSFGGGIDKGLGTIVKAAIPGTTKATLGNTDLSVLIGKAVSVTIGTTSGGKDKVTAITSLMKGMTIDEVSDRAVLFDFDDPTIEAYASLPGFVHNKLKEALNYSGSNVEKIAGQAVAEKVDAGTELSDSEVESIL